MGVGFQAETLYVCSKPCFGHTYKDSAWNFHDINVISGVVYFRDIILESSQAFVNKPSSSLS